MGDECPSARWTLSYLVSDGHGGTSAATVTMTVTLLPAPPTPALAVTATPTCGAGAAYLRYAVCLPTPALVAGVAAATSGSVTITWQDSTGLVIATFTGQPTNGTWRGLWRGGGGLDGSGTATDWPGWIFVAGVRVQGSDGEENTRAGSTTLEPTWALR